MRYFQTKPPNTASKSTKHKTDGFLWVSAPMQAWKIKITMFTPNLPTIYAVIDVVFIRVFDNN
jgi:hypothetical protein